ncbi:MAG: RibD family protein [Granulosicoccus sp.]|nr:RibD family protein [Granulosicoccus sp.]
MIWNTLICLKRQLSRTPASRVIALQGLSSSTPMITIDPDQDAYPRDTDLLILLTDSVRQRADAAAGTIVQASGAFALKVESDDGLDSDQLKELTTYLPYALLPCFSYKHQRCYTISHFAQTLDGRIAAKGGDSRWIGNEENLTHAHKMRALCDGILIGNNTLKIDNPRLNVRKVTGQDPIPIVMGNDVNAIDACKTNTENLLHITSDERCNGSSCIYVKKQDGQFDCHEIRRLLQQRKFSSVYIEGGSATTSAFLKHNALDQVQVHISPQILGSGLTGFEFSGAENMDQARTFLNPRFVAIGGHIMFLGEL